MLTKVRANLLYNVLTKQNQYLEKISKVESKDRRDIPPVYQLLLFVHRELKQTLAKESGSV